MSKEDFEIRKECFNSACTILSQLLPKETVYGDITERVKSLSVQLYKEMHDWLTGK